MKIISKTRKRIIFITLIEALSLWGGSIFLSFIFVIISPLISKILLLISPFPPLYHFIVKFRKFRNDINVADVIERAYPGFENRLKAYVEVESQGKTKAYSDFLLKKLAEETNKLVEKVDLKKTYKPDGRFFRFLFYSAMIFFVLFDVFGESYTKGLLALKGEQEKFVDYAVVKPPYLKAFSDSTVSIRVLPVNFKPETLCIALSSDSVRYVFREDTVINGALIYQLQGVRPGVYTVSIPGRVKSNIARIDVIEKPFIDSVIVYARMPSYLGSAVYTARGPRYLSYLSGTRLRFKIFSSTSDSLLVNRRKVKRNGKGYIYSMTVSDTENIVFTLFKSGLSTNSPYEISVIPITDNPPGVEILFPQGVFDLPEDMKIPLIIRSYDDFGLKSLSLMTKFGKSIQDTTIKKFHGEFEDTTVLKLSLGNVPMMPGDELYIYAIATDLKNQKDTSDVLIVRFPTLEEMYRQTAAVSDTGFQTVREIKNRTEKIMEKIKQLETAIKSERNVDWSKKESLKELINQEKKFIEQVKKSFERINQALDQLQQKMSLDPELMKKIQEVQKLFQEAMTDELRQILENLNKLMQKKITPQQLEQALQNLKINQEMLKQNLERMENILKRFAQEQKLKEFAQKLRELENQEVTLKNRIEVGDSSKLLALKQEEIQKKIGNLKQELKTFADSLEDRELKKAINCVADKDLKNLENLAYSAKNNLMSGDRQEAAQQMEKTAQKLENVAQKLENLQKNLVKKRKKELVEKIRMVRQSLIFVSGLQINVNKSIRNLNRSLKVSYFDLAQQEEAALSATEMSFRKMLEIFKNTMALSPQALGLTYGAMETMKNVKSSLEQFRTPSQKQLSRALGYINMAILQLYGAEKNLQQGSGSSTYFEQAMKKLSQAAQQQAKLNQQGKGMMTMPSPAMSQLLAMAAQQAAIRQLVEQALKLTQGSSNLSRMLEEISREMEDVEKSLKQGKYNEKIFEKQKKLLVRLLEAQRSIHKQEFTRKRESKPGEFYKIKKPPEELKEEVLRKRIKSLLFDIDRDKNIPENYRVLIKAYLKSLLEE